MPTEQTHYDIFLSYSRADNVLLPGTNLRWVEAIKQRIEQDHARFSNQKLRIFYDEQEIRSMDDWRHRILGALIHSRLLLICSSPNYYASEYCQWEWQEYQQRLQRYKMGEDTIANVRLRSVEAPANEPIKAWYDATRRGNYTDLSPWYHDRTEAMLEEEIARLLEVLGEQVWQRMQRVRLAENALEVGNLRGGTPYFVGRRAELRAIHEQVGLGKMGLVSAVHAQGGIGKTELAVHYARMHAHSYPAGIWMLNASGRKELIPLIGTLAYAAEFNFDVPQAIKDDEQRLGEAVLSELQRRSMEMQEKDPDGGSSTLLILDNVTEPTLLSLSELVKLKEPRWLRLLATSRRGEDEIPPVEGILTHLPIPGVSREESLDLIDGLTRQRYRSNPAEWAALEELVTILDGFTLALDQVGSYLGLKAEEGVLPSQYLVRLKAEGLVSLDDLPKEQRVADRILHQEKQYAVILEWNMNELARTPLALDALRFASLLPSARIPWVWLEMLVRVRHGDAAKAMLGYPDPWATARRRLQGMRLLLPGDQDGLGRMHDLTSAHVREDALRYAELLDALLVLLKWRCDSWRKPSRERLGLGELEILNDSLIGLLGIKGMDGVFSLLGNLIDPVSIFLGTDAALRNASTIQTCALERTESDPSNSELQHDLSVSYDKLGDLSSARGVLEEAARLYDESLKVRAHMALAEPSNSQWQRDLSVSYDKLGNLSRARGDLGEAARLFGESLKVRERFALADPSNNEWQRNLSISYNKLGDLSSARGDLGEAARLYGEDLKIAERLALADPNNSEWQRDLSVSYEKLGDLSGALGELSEAARFYGESLKLREQLALADPSNNEWQRDLSVSYDKLGDLSRARGDIGEAAGLYGKSLRVRERLALADPSNSQWQRDLSVSYVKLGNLSRARGDLNEAARLYGASLNLSDRLALADPNNSQWQRDLSVSYEKLGDLSGALGELSEAARFYGESLKIAERLALADPSNSQWQHDLSISYNKLGDLSAQQQCDLEAIGQYLKGLAALDALVRISPEDVRLQHDKAMFNHDLFRAYGRLEQWRECIAHALAVVQLLGDMEERGMELDNYLKGIGEQCMRLLKQVQEQQEGTAATEE